MASREHSYSATEGGVNAPDTLTRSELEERRGGFEGNGAGDLVSHHDSSPPKRIREEAFAAANERRHQEALARRAANGKGPRKPPSPPRSKPSTAMGAFGIFDLAGLLAAAVPPGVSFSVEVGGVTISACRE
jgi:hypothetical protein